MSLLSEFFLDSRFRVAFEAMQESLKTIMRVYEGGFQVKDKADGSPLTEADLDSDRVIRAKVLSSFPDDSYLSEEEEDDLSRLSNEFVWIVDPLDGTEDFAKRDGMFCVNLALAKKNALAFGLVGVPLTGEIFFGVKGRGAHLFSRGKDLEKLSVSRRREGLRAVVSAYHAGEAEESALSSPLVASTLRVGSSLKACAIASGKADVCLRFSPGASEWDTAAPNLLVQEAGGVYLSSDLEEIRYNQRDVAHAKGYAVANSLQTLTALLHR